LLPLPSIELTNMPLKLHTIENKFLFLSALSPFNHGGCKFKKVQNLKMLQAFLKLVHFQQ